MQFRELSIAGAWEITPVPHADSRGILVETYRADLIAEQAGSALELVQANLSVSSRGVVRGMHYTAVPPGQVKYVSCVRGAVLDVVADIRIGSPTFGRWEAVRLDDVDRRSLFIPVGLAHGYCALTDDATMLYLCSTDYRPEREHSISPFDADLNIVWPIDDPVLSPRDRDAPSLAVALQQRLLPQCDPSA